MRRKATQTKVGENSVMNFRVKVFRKVERIRGGYKELLLCYVGKSNYFFYLTGKMSVRFSG